MTALKKIFVAGYVGIIVMFGISAFGLLAFTGVELWEAFNPMLAQPLTERFNSVLKAIAMLTITLAAPDLADTVIEEEFKREGHLSGTARTRRVLARFLVVVVVSLSIESLVTVFQFVHDAPEMLPYAAAIALGAGALLVAWGLFDRMMRSPE